jgi:hypothetical protein
MSNTNTGGPAFPQTEVDRDGVTITHHSGMTLRDYFAAKAMQGLMGRAWGELPPEELFKTWATSAYAVADAMLEARDGKP